MPALITKARKKLVHSVSPRPQVTVKAVEGIHVMKSDDTMSVFVPVGSDSENKAFKLRVYISSAKQGREIAAKIRVHGFRVEFVRRTQEESQQNLESPFAGERARAFARMQERPPTDEEIGVRQAFLVSLNGEST